MPKMKTHSSAKKRFKTTAKGRVKAKSAFMRHMQTNKPKKMKRKARALMVLSDPDARKVLRNYLPGTKTKAKAPKPKKEEAK